MPSQSASYWIGTPKGDGWGVRFAEAVDNTVKHLAEGREIVSVSVAPINYMIGGPGDSGTVGVIVTVVTNA